MSEAVQRIESILHKELEKAGQDEAKIEAAWAKHAARLESAILPACKLFCRYRDDDYQQLASTIAATVKGRRLVMAGIEELVLSSSTESSV